MLLHHTTLSQLLLKACQRLEAENKPNDQLCALLRELETVSEQAEAHDKKLRGLLDSIKTKLK
jgi:small-conductance mechanosensitive channel